MKQSSLFSILTEYEALAHDLAKHERIRKLINGDFALPVFAPLVPPATFKGAYGGRGGAKSYFFADLHLHYALERHSGYRALCLRQVQKSIRESLKFLLEQRMQFWGVGDKFRVLESRIETPGGGEFVFHGLEGHTAESIKSFEGFDVADIEEGQMIRPRPFELLVPTIIRKKGAEIWARWNPRHDSDSVDKFFRGTSRPESAVAVEASWDDNPYLNEATLTQIAADYRSDPEKADHIWGGGYEIITEGAYYARDLAAAVREGRIGDFAHDPDRKVSTAWDIGVDDYTAIWFLQSDGVRVRAIDYYETSGDGAVLIVEQAIKSKPYDYDAHYFPHDVKVREWGRGAKSRLETLIELGIPARRIHVGAAQGAEERINAVRRLLPAMLFNRETTALGVKRLRSYRRKFNTALGSFQGPLHDENSHGADAFGEYAVNCPQLQRNPEKHAPSIADAFKAPTFDDMRMRNAKRRAQRRKVI